MLKRIKVGVKIMPREVILDTQGRALEQSLNSNSMPVAQCRVGRFVELEFENLETIEQAVSRSEEIAKTLLCNPLIETFELTWKGQG